MKQVLQNIRTGKVAVEDVPMPSATRGRVLVRTAASIISAGTEKLAIDSGQKSLLGRAKERPELVKQVIEKFRTDGIIETYAAVKSKLDSSTALGYSAAGVVVEAGEGVTGFRVGDRVACAGAGLASHAELISVPQNLCSHLPEGVAFDEGAFATLGAIALQGVRLAAPTLGASVVVVGLGLLGQITVQLLAANGCRVFGVDLDTAKLELALKSGADACSTPDDARAMIDNGTRNRGADAVLITAGTSSNDPVELAGDVSRSKGSVVVVGLVGMNIPRAAYFKKELSFQVSMSYGPGRYDPEYEERGHDYPIGYVRWTEGRNLEAFLDLVAAGKLDIRGLISHRFPVERAEDAYNLISGKTSEPYLGIVLEYDLEKTLGPTIGKLPIRSSDGKVSIGMIGGGGYSRAVLLPSFKASGAAFDSIATASGLSARDLGRQFDFRSVLSNAEEVIAETNTNLIVIATHHNSHAPLAIAALDAGKNVFVEKPLALTEAELDDVIARATVAEGSLMVGFNRRFSTAAREAAKFFEGRSAPLSILYRVNAGRVARGHWTQDPDVGGGRIVGEVCHFIDLMQFLTGSLVTRVFAEKVGRSSGEAIDEDSVLITLAFADGSNGAIAYLAEGDKKLSKERVEIYGGSKSFVIDDFRETSAFAGGKETRNRTKSQDKGQAEQARVVCAVVRDGLAAPIPLKSLATTTRATFRVLESLRTGQALTV